MNEPAYPIFFPTYTPVDTGYARDWWWYDPEVAISDIGPFETRSEAVADWAWEHFQAALADEAEALERALASPLLLAGCCPARAALQQQADAVQALLEAGVTVVSQLETQSRPN